MVWTAAFPGVARHGGASAWGSSTLSFPSVSGIGRFRIVSSLQSLACPLQALWELQSWRPQASVSPVALGISVEIFDRLTENPPGGTIQPKV